MLMSSKSLQAKTAKQACPGSEDTITCRQRAVALWIRSVLSSMLDRYFKKRASSHPENLNEDEEVNNSVI